MMECSLEVMEQPAERVKFRMEVHSHRCQQTELLLGRTGMPDDTVTFPKVRLVPRPGAAIRPNTLVRMSLVDIRSTPDNIIDHWHRLVDCQEKVLSPSWAVVKLVEQPYGWVTFCSLGVVKTLERERGREVGERAIVRREEHGATVRGERHRELEVRDRAEERCRETCAFRLKLCFEAFLQAEDGTIQEVAEPVFSENVLDETRPDKSGDLPVQKISACSDTVEGGQEVMVFTGNEATRIPLRRSNFYVEFFELEPDNQKRWQSGRLQVPRAALHGLGQILGGLVFKVPVFDRDQPGSGRPAAIEAPTENVFFEIVKTNKAGKEEAKSDPIHFTYKPSRLQPLAGKRLRDPRHIFPLGKMPKLEAATPFVPTFMLREATSGNPTVTITNVPVTTGNTDIPTLIESISQPSMYLTPQTHPLPPTSPMSPSTSFGNMALNSPQPHQAHSPAPYSSSPQMSHVEMIPSTVDAQDCQLAYMPAASQPIQQMFTQQVELPDINDQNIDEFITELLAPPSDMTTLSQNFSGSADGRIFFDGYRKTETICMDGGKHKVTIKEEKSGEEKDILIIKEEKSGEEKDTVIIKKTVEDTNNKKVIMKKEKSSKEEGEKLASQNKEDFAQSLQQLKIEP